MVIKSLMGQKISCWLQTFAQCCTYCICAYILFSIQYTTFHILASFPYTTAMLLTLFCWMCCFSVSFSSSETKPMNELSGVWAKCVCAWVAWTRKNNITESFVSERHKRKTEKEQYIRVCLSKVAKSEGLDWH